VNDFTQLFNNALSQIVVYPNPVTDQLSINGLPEPMAISLISAHGQTIGVWKVANSQYQIDCSAYQPGMYLLRFENASGALMQRVIQIQ
jgi:hypothetical protein